MFVSLDGFPLYKVSDADPRDLSEEYNRWQELVDHLKVRPPATS